MRKDEAIIAAVEGGGTSFVVAVAKVVPHSIPQILYRREVDSSHEQPEKTLSECAAFFREYKPPNGYSSLGIATFGPVGLDPSRVETYGRILNTSPKKSWRNVDFLSPLSEACRGSRSLSVKIETDVNAPAYSEYLLEKDNLSSVAYITVGTGIGVGLVIHGKPVHGRMHPEGGHVPVQTLEGDKFEGYSWGGKSPFQGRRTVEGITSSVALTERLEQMTNEKNLPRGRLMELDDDHEVWDHSANALANLCVTLLLTTSIEKIVLGGGVMNRQGLIGKIRAKTVDLLNGYLELPNDISGLICMSSYGNDVGLIGALVLAQSAYEEGQDKAKGPNLSDSSAFTVGFVHGVVVGALATLAAVAMISHRKK